MKAPGTLAARLESDYTPSRPHDSVSGHNYPWISTSKFSSLSNDESEITLRLGDGFKLTGLKIYLWVIFLFYFIFLRTRSNFSLNPTLDYDIRSQIKSK